MQPINKEAVQEMLTELREQELYLCQEMTTGAYAAHPASMFIKNAKISYSTGSIAGNGPYRIGLKTPHGWVYTQGLTHWNEGENQQMILAGHDDQGRLVVGLQLSKHPF